MKKFTIAIVSILLCASAHAQSFKKGSNIIEMDFGLGYYSNVENNIRLNGGSGAVQTYKDRAGSGIIGVQYERGLGKFLGLGLRFARQGYLDSANQDNVDASSFDVGLVLNAHFVRAKRVDLYASLTLGGTSLVIDDNRSAAKYKGTGTYLDLGLGARFYIGNAFFFTTKFQMATMNVDGEYQNVANNQFKGSWDANGIKLAVGLGLSL